MRTFLTCFLLLAIGSAFQAQNVLKPSIGLDSLPSDNAAICPIPLYLGNFDASGLQVGDTAADFRLYKLNNEAFHLASALATGKPVLLVAGNYTCPVFRNKLSALNQIVASYGDSVTIAIIYGVEAHPNIDISPYFGAVNTGQSNINAGILYRQPTTYGERKAVAADMLAGLNIPAPVYLDGPCNAWWQHYGPAPNNAYLIGTNGVVYAKHGWFDRAPDDMICDIKAYFQNDCGPGGPTNGTFSFEVTTKDTVYGPAGTTLYAEGLLQNKSAQAVNILVKKLQNNLPAAWETSLCIDVCYPASVDSVVIQLPPNSEQVFYFYFYTDDQPAAGFSRIGFRNEADPQNKFVFDVFARSQAASGTHSNTNQTNWAPLFPNPATDRLYLPTDPAIARLVVFDQSGRLVMGRKSSAVLDLHDLPAGNYRNVYFDRFGVILGAQSFFKF